MCVCVKHTCIRIHTFMKMLNKYHRKYSQIVYCLLIFLQWSVWMIAFYSVVLVICIVFLLSPFFFLQSSILLCVPHLYLEIRHTQTVRLCLWFGRSFAFVRMLCGMKLKCVARKQTIEKFNWFICEWLLF